MPHRFDGAEQWAKRFDSPDRDAWQKPAEVIDKMTLREGMTVADIGAGTGYFLGHLSRAVGSTGLVLALDVEPDMVRYMKERAAREKLSNVQPRRIDPDTPGLEASSVDRVLLVNTWHHISSRTSYAAALKRSLRAGGAIVVVDFHPHSSKGPPKKHKLAPAAVAKELEAAGLEVELLLDSLPEQYIAIARAPVQ